MSGGGSGFGQAQASRGAATNSGFGGVANTVANSGAFEGGMGGLKAGAGPSNISPMPTMGYNPMQSAPQQSPMQPPPTSPLIQQQMMRQSPYQQPQMSGLQAALMQMLGQYNRPMARPQMQQMQQYQGMPQYQNSALQYRPDITGAQQNLGRVAKSVVLQQKEAAEAELAAMREAEAARESQQSNDYSGGG